MPDMESVYEFLEKSGPFCSALFATACFAFIGYMVFVDWKLKKEAEYKERIADLEALCARKDEQLNASLQKQCEMAYELNELDGAYNDRLVEAEAEYRQQVIEAEARAKEANDRAEGDKKRADRMAEIADEFRNKAGSAA